MGDLYALDYLRSAIGALVTGFGDFLYSWRIHPHSAGRRHRGAADPTDHWQAGSLSGAPSHQAKPRNSRAGSVMIAQTSSSTPSTAMPTIRNGRSKSQTRG